MAKWAFWTVLLYIALVVVLFIPLLLSLAFLSDFGLIELIPITSVQA
jgi:hypothetical protein